MKLGDDLPIERIHTSLRSHVAGLTEAPEVLRFRDHAFHEYFSSPRYLEMVDRKFGPDTVQHVTEMTSHRLVRQYAQAPTRP